MPKFATISPSHISGKKPEAWENFRDGEYIAIGSVVCRDLSGKSLEQIKEIVVDEETKAGDKDPQKKAWEYEQFFSLDIGDYVAVNNTNSGLFGIGAIASGYYFDKHAPKTIKSRVLKFTWEFIYDNRVFAEYTYFN